MAAKHVFHRNQFFLKRELNTRFILMSGVHIDGMDLVRIIVLRIWKDDNIHGTKKKHQDLIGEC